MALKDQSILRVVLYEGEGAQPLEAQERFAALSALLEKGYSVTRSTVGGRVAPADRSALLVLGRFDDGRVPQAEQSTGEVAIRFQDIAGFDASRHIARIILTAMRFDPRCRSAINLKYREKNSTRLKKIGFAAGTFARGMQPEGTSTMEWGTEQAIRKLGRVPDVIADRGDVGKEAMVRVLGTEPKDVLRKVRRLVRG